MRNTHKTQTPPTLAEYCDKPKAARGKKVSTLASISMLGTLVVALLLATNFTTNATSFNKPIDGSVVVIGDDLVVETDSPFPTISWILIDYAATGTQAAFYTGCGADYCIYDISSLPSGTYNVTVQTSGGRFFKGGVIVP